VHHCTPWEQGGPTAITNGALLCRSHHTFVHQHRWTITLDQHQQPVTRRPDGTEHTVCSQRPQRE
jgi:predicted restriction endonuclease